MFTGIIEFVGEISRFDRHESGARIEIASEAPQMAEPLASGQSIAVNGCCLTVTESRPGTFTADLSPETIRRTSFRHIESGSFVNLERPLRAGAELGGHFVLGHVDGVGQIARLRREGENAWLIVKIGPELERYVAMKGSLAIDGISLTVADCAKGMAEFAIIPFTIAHTNLRGKASGDFVNVEVDVLARYLERLLAAPSSEPSASRLTLDRLIEEGF